jgi:hypothetical protein
MRRLSSSHFVFAGLLVLAGCGGGGSSSSDQTPVSGDTSNVFSPMVGTYVAPCDGLTNGNALSELGSADGSIAIESLVGSDRAKVSVRLRQYTGTTCSSSALQTDLTVRGEIRDLAQTKAYLQSGQTVNARVVEFSYSGLTLARGSFQGSLPLPGATTKVAYLLVGNQLYTSKGIRGADGLGDRLSRNFAVKQ